MVCAPNILSLSRPQPTEPPADCSARSPPRTTLPAPAPAAADSVRNSWKGELLGGQALKVCEAPPTVRVQEE